MILKIINDSTRLFPAEDKECVHCLVQYPLQSKTIPKALKTLLLSSLYQDVVLVSDMRVRLWIFCVDHDKQSVSV